MAGFAGGSGGGGGGPNEVTGGGLDTLFAQLRQRNSNPTATSSDPRFLSQRMSSNEAQVDSSLAEHTSSSNYHQPAVATTTATPPTRGPQPHHDSAIMSPNITSPQPQPQAGAVGSSSSSADRTANLLNLLKFSQPASSSPSQVPTATLDSQQSRLSFGAQSIPHQSEKRLSSESSSLLATLMGTAQSSVPRQSPSEFQIPAAEQQPAAAPFKSPPSAGTQDFLVGLLQRPKPSPQSETAASLPSNAVNNPAAVQLGANETAKSSRSTLSEDQFGSGRDEFISRPEAASQQHLRREPASKISQGLFTYVNPFEQLAASSPRKRTSTSSTPVKSSPSTSHHILKNPRHSEALDDVITVEVEEDDHSPRPSGSKKLSQEQRDQSSAPPTPLPDGRTQIEALMGIGKSRESVADAVAEVGGQVNKEVEDAIQQAELDQSNAIIEKDMNAMLSAKSEEDFLDKAHTAALDIKQELEKEGNDQVLRENLPSPVVEAVKGIIDDAAQGHVVDSWESADADDMSAQGEARSLVKVFNFPMKPWISVNVTATNASELPEMSGCTVMEVARVKKEFDQIDRTLAAATKNFIVYAIPKTGGARAIRQDSGVDVKLFPDTKDRIFNVACSTSGSDGTQTFIGTGVSGTVYWETLRTADGSFITDPYTSKNGFALPPLHSQDVESAGGVLKTRARKSSAHTDFFAVGRGKSIHIIWPSIIVKQSYLLPGIERIVDTEKYLKSRSLKINTGKAGKDFTFSPDDTTIVSLDKAGRVKFWDVRTLTNTSRSDDMRYPSPEQIQPVEIKEPLMTLNTTHTNEKPWPTSVMFLDKLRPYQKGGALRYIIIGMKQNHSLQLWDLALGKPVQEIHFPHEKESDAICSVTYHAATGMIVVGHPTRNSIYFIHLSAPKYNVPKNTSQADYVEKIVAKDKSMVKPDSTAVMSGMREYSLKPRGILRSLDMLQSPAMPPEDGSEPALFEIYVVHSKGITCLGIKSEDLGWDKDNKVENSIDGEEAKVITTEDLQPLQSVSETSSEAVPAPPTAMRTVPSIPKEVAAKDVPKKPTAPKTQPDQRIPDMPTNSIAAEKPPTQTTAINGAGVHDSPSSADKSEKKRRKKTASSARGGVENPSDLTQTSLPDALKTSMPAAAASTSSELPTSDRAFRSTPSSQISQSQLKSTAEDPVGSSSTSSDVPPAAVSQETMEGLLKGVRSTVSDEVSRQLGISLDDLYRRFDDDKRTNAAVSDARQDAVLRLVSSTLADNVDKTLASIVTTNTRKHVVPAVSDVILRAVNEQLGPKLNSHLSRSLPKELENILPTMLSRTLQKPALSDAIAETLAKSVQFKVEEQFANVLSKSVVPAFTSLAVEMAQKVGGEVHRQATEQIGSLERQRQADGQKIDQLTQLVTGLSETISSIAASQDKYQAEVLKLQQSQQQQQQQQQQAASDRESSQAAAAAAGSNSDNGYSYSDIATINKLTPRKSEEQLQLEETLVAIDKAMSEGGYEEACMRWLQSDREQEMFEHFFSKVDPAFVHSLNPLILLSLSSTITAELESKLLLDRLTWLDSILQAFQSCLGQLDHQVRDVTPKIMGTIIARLEHLFMRVSNISAQDPLLKRLSLMVSATNRIIESTRPY